MRSFRWSIRSRSLVLGNRTLIMGVLNVTPDSFSDGGEFLTIEKAVARAMAIEAAGADILDVGGESTRPGARAISAEIETERVIPVIRALRGKIKIPISIDTRRAVVAESALESGAEIVNDVSALSFDERMADVVARSKAGVILTHIRGSPDSMQKEPFARDVIADVRAGLRRALTRAKRTGINRAKIVVDPGIGFGKSFAQNFEILTHLGEIAKLGFPLLVGPSRKGFIGAAISSAKRPAPPSERVWGTAAAVTAAILFGAHIVRVHDVTEMVQVARVVDRLRESL
jgi:dihydropteroate synthase